jgi:hypothetical protein
MTYVCSMDQVLISEDFKPSQITVEPEKLRNPHAVQTALSFD